MDDASSFADRRSLYRVHGWDAPYRSDHPSLRFAHRPPEENIFAAKLAEILGDRQKYDLTGMPQFADIDPRIADACFSTILRPALEGTVFCG